MYWHENSNAASTCDVKATRNCVCRKPCGGGGGDAPAPAPAPAPTYVQVSSGTCESNGYEAITDVAECETAGKDYVFTNFDGSPNGVWSGSTNTGSYPSNCIPVPNTAAYYSSYQTPHTFFNTNDNNNECDKSQYRVCLCKNTAGGGDAPAPAPAPAEGQVTYVHVSSGTCESNGYYSIRDAAECETAAPQFVFQDGDAGNFLGAYAEIASYPARCIITPYDNSIYRNVYFNTNANDNDCDSNVNRQCLCRNGGDPPPPAAKCSTLTCPSGYIAKSDAATINCDGATCTESWDRDTCCEIAYVQVNSGTCESNGYETITATACEHLVKEGIIAGLRDDDYAGRWGGSAEWGDYQPACSMQKSNPANVYFNNQMNDECDVGSGGYVCICRKPAAGPAPTYVQVISGTCEDSGYEVITDAAECETASKNYVFDNFDGSPKGQWDGLTETTSYPGNCLHVPNTVEYPYSTPRTWFNGGTHRTADCGVHEHRACLCRNPAGGGGGGGDAQVCTSEDDFRGNDWAKYSGPNTDWVPPDITDSPYDQSKITSPNQYNGASYDASFTFDRQTFANECARGCAAKDTGHTEMYINYISGSRYECYCMGGGEVPTFVANEPADKSYFAAKYTCTGDAPAPAPAACSDNDILKSPSQSSSSDAKSLAAAESYCTARSMEVCTYASICPDGVLTTPKLGANPSDSWVITKNGEWVQTSDLRPERLCRTHKSYLIDAGHTTEESYVAEDWVEAWMADVTASFKREVYCCTSEYNACTGGGDVSTCPTHNGDKAACCAEDGCAYAAGDDCIAEGDLAGNTDLCDVVDAPVSDVNFNYGFQTVEACVGSSITVKWQGTHNIQETTGPDCDSAKIGSPLNLNSPSTNEFLSAGHSMQFTNNELNAQAGKTRYFKCDTHCGASAARFEISCPAATDPCNCPVPLDMKDVGVGTKVVCEDTSVTCTGDWIAYGGGCYHPTCKDTSCCSGGNADPCDPNPCLNGATCSEGKCTCTEGYSGETCQVKAGAIFRRPDTKCSTAAKLCARKHKELKPNPWTIVCPDHRCTSDICCDTIAPTTCQNTIGINAQFCTRIGRVNNNDLSNTCAKYPCKPKECCSAPSRGCKTGDACNADDSFDQHVEEKCFTCHSRSTCTDKKCVCPDGYGGVKCDLRISQGARQDKIKAIRRANGGRLGQTPTESQKKQRQEAYKAFVEDIVRAKIAAGASVKDTIKENTLTIAKSDLPAQAAVVITRTPRIAAVPDNAEQDDDCHLGASATNCGMVDLKDDRDSNQQTIVNVGNDVGSWAVVVDDGNIVSKQTRTGTNTYDMQCWDPDAGDWEATEQMSEGEVFECNGRAIYIGSQVGVCDETTCQNDGTCAASGNTFTCVCPIAWMGQLCDIPNNAGNDGNSSTCTEAFDKADKVSYQNLNCACRTTCE